MRSYLINPVWQWASVLESDLESDSVFGSDLESDLKIFLETSEKRENVAITWTTSNYCIACDSSLNHIM